MMFQRQLKLKHKISLTNATRLVIYHEHQNYGLFNGKKRMVGRLLLAWSNYFQDK